MEHRIVERLTVVTLEGVRREWEWADVTDAGAWWLYNGRLAVNGETVPVAQVEVQAPAVLAQVEASIVDLAPTAAQALGLPAPAQATGTALDVPPAKHVLLLFLDGFGYLRYAQALAQGDIPHLASLEEPVLALTTYPPVTSVSTASLLTGAPPRVHGADRRGIRKTETETLFDVVAAAGHNVVAIEGEALAFELRNAEWQLSGDRDGNGSTDDNVRANSLHAILQEMPALLYVHLHGIDDAGHTYGPGTPEERATVREVDTIVGELLEAVPSGTLSLIFADHGMHHVDEAGRLGNHGHLIPEDMLIPILIVHR
jgi:predicted AlkP superfamily pyrophosphatase or phosphodiesterase